MRHRVVTAAESRIAARRQPDLRPESAVDPQAYEPSGYGEPVVRKRSEVVAVDGRTHVFAVAGQKNGGRRRRREHPEHPDRRSAALGRPSVRTAVPDPVLAAVGHQCEFRRQGTPQRHLRLPVREEFDATRHPDLKTGSGGVAKRHFSLEAHLPGIAPDHPERLGVQRRRNLPVGIDLLGAGCEVEREGTALGPEPEAFFAAERVEPGFPEPRSDQRAVYPAVAGSPGSGRRRGHHPSLPRRNQTDPRPARFVGQLHDPNPATLQE